MKIYGQIKDAQLEGLAADPANLPEGRVWLNTTSDTAKFHDGSQVREVVTTDQAQTLTNKTLTSPVISEPTGLDKSDVGLSNVDNTSDADKPISDATQAALDDKIDQSELDDHVNATTSVHGISNAADLATKSGTETLSNKTLPAPYIDTIVLDGQGVAPGAPAAGDYKLYVDDVSKKLTLLNSAGVKTAVGAGAGGVEFISNGNGEAGTAGWEEGSYSAAARPTGAFTTGSGTGVFEISASSTNPLDGKSSFILKKYSGASRQGMAKEFEFDLPHGYRAKVLDINISYIVNSGAFVAGDKTTDSSVIWYAKFWDGSNWTFEEPRSFKMLASSTTVSDILQGSVQTPYNATKMRLIAYVAESANSAWEVKFTASVRPAEYVFGSPITAPGEYSPSYAGFSTSAGQVKSWREGAYLNIAGIVTVSSPVASEARVYFPSSSMIAASDLPAGSNYAGSVLTSAQTDAQAVVLVSPGENYFKIGIQGATRNGFTPVNANIVFSNGTVASFLAKIPIQGWSSSVQMSDRTDTRVVAASYWLTSNTACTANVTNIPFSGMMIDTYNAMAAGIYTAPVAGIYEIEAFLSETVNANYAVIAYVNGAARCALGGRYSASCVVVGKVEVKAGDQISLRIDANNTLVGAASPTTTSCKIHITRISGPAAIAASEMVAASYFCSANQTGSTSTPFNFDSMEYDTHGAVSTGSAWKFTAPANGLYNISGLIFGNSVASSIVSLLYKNGVAYKPAIHVNGSISSSSLSIDLRLNAGDYIDIRPQASMTARGGALSSASVTSNISIRRVGI